MKFPGTLLALLFSLNCIAQRQCVNFNYDFELPKPLTGKVKLIRYSNSSFLNPKEIKKQAFNKSDHHVDSFDEAGYKVLSYDMANDMAKNTTGLYYEFDNNGKITKTYGSNNGSRILYDAFEYDSTGRLIAYTKDRNSLSKFLKYSYLSNYNVIKIDSESNGTISRYEFKCSGSVMEEINTTGGGQKPVRKYVYDKKGNIVTEEWTNGYRKAFTYDNRNNKISEELFYTSNNKMNKVNGWQYTYDSKGNWTQCLAEDNTANAPVYRLTIRQIEYY